MKENTCGLSLDGSIDYNITYDEEEQEYIVDIFDASVQDDANAAYIETFVCDTFAAALQDAQTYQLNFAV